MAVGHELAVGGEALHRLSLPLRVVAVNVVEHAGLEHEEPGVDPPFRGLRLLRELDHAIAVEPQVPEAGRRPARGDGGEPTVPAVKGEELVQIDVTHAIAPREHEGLGAEVGSEALDAAARQGVDARVDEVHVPVGQLAEVASDISCAEVDAQIAVE